ncbi:hypothetical protein ABBQ38_012300 [Trebouxia sp. C0009 RCD-2024]
MRFGLGLPLLLCVLLTGSALAEEAQTPAGGYRHWLTDLAPPLAGVETQHWFPDHPGARFTVGGPVDVVLGLHNSAGEAFNITHIAGSINSPQAFQYYVQNFTLKPYNSYLKPGEQASLQYTFKPDSYLPVQEWQLSLTAYLRTDRGFFCNTFFNQTVDVVDQPRWIDTQLLFLGLIGCGVLGVIALFSWDSISNLALVKRANKRTRKPASRPAPGPKVVAPAGTSEWLKGTNYGQESRSRLKKESSRKLPSSAPTSPQ